jgi:hypothetical protein
MNQSNDQSFETPVEQPVETSVNTEKASVEKVSVEKASVEKVSVEKVSVEKVSVEKASVEKVSVEKVSVEKVSVEKASVEKVSVEKPVKKPYLKTKVFYKFSKKSGKETLNEIKSRTDDLKSIGAPIMMTKGVCETVDREEYIEDLLYEINNAKVVYYGRLNAPEEGSINKKVIGKGGCYFYKTTYDNNIFFIWHNKDTKSYEFWGGDYYGMINSMNAISHRIEKCSE